MQAPNFILLYVENPLSSSQFYTQLLEKNPIESSPTFVLFALANGLMLGLWAKHTVEPKPENNSGGSEIAFAVANDEEVKKVYALWETRKLPMLQKPTAMDFGYTFVACDPDGHRLRVFTPSVG